MNIAPLVALRLRNLEYGVLLHPFNLALHALGRDDILLNQGHAWEVRYKYGDYKLNDTHLGGEIFVYRAMDLRMQNMAENHRAVRKLDMQCERARCTLLPSTAVTVEIESLFDGISSLCTLSRARFEQFRIFNSWIIAFSGKYDVSKYNQRSF